MSRIIDPDKLESGDLTDDEILYLQDRGQLPPHIEPIDRDAPRVDGNDPLKDVLNTGDANTAGISREEFEAFQAWREANQSQPSMGDSGGIEDDDGEPEDYAEGWNNDQRMAELVQRGLSDQGNKPELIARLLRSDNDELETDDYPSPT